MVAHRNTNLCTRAHIRRNTSPVVVATFEHMINALPVAVCPTTVRIDAEYSSLTCSCIRTVWLNITAAHTTARSVPVGSADIDKSCYKHTRGHRHVL